MSVDQAVAEVEKSQLQVVKLKERNTHYMITRSKVGSSKPNHKYELKNEAAAITAPTSVKTALSHPRWLKAMQEKLSAL